MYLSIKIEALKVHKCLVENLDLHQTLKYPQLIPDIVLRETTQNICTKKPPSNIFQPIWVRYFSKTKKTDGLFDEELFLEI